MFFCVQNDITAFILRVVCFVLYGSLQERWRHQEDQ